MPEFILWSLVLVSLIVSPVIGIINYLKLRQMDNALQSYEDFLTTIASAQSSLADSFAKMAAGVNPSGLTADDAVQLKTDLGNAATALKTFADSVAQAATNAGQGAAAPAAPATPDPNAGGAAQQANS